MANDSTRQSCCLCCYTHYDWHRAFVPSCWSMNTFFSANHNWTLDACAVTDVEWKQWDFWKKFYYLRSLGSVENGGRAFRTRIKHHSWRSRIELSSIVYAGCLYRLRLDATDEGRSSALRSQRLSCCDPPGGWQTNLSVTKMSVQNVWKSILLKFVSEYVYW